MSSQEFPSMTDKLSAAGDCQAISLVSNHFIFKSIDSSFKLRKFAIQFEPDIPADNQQMRRRVVSSIREQLLESIGSQQNFITSLVGVKQLEGDAAWFSAVVDDTNQIVRLFDTHTDSYDTEMNVFYNSFFNRLQRNLNLHMIGRSFQDSSTSQKLPEHKIELWNGQNTAIHNLEGGSMLRINTSTRVLRTETCLDYMRQLYTEASEQNKNPQEHIKASIIGSTILTRYNNRSYRVDDIDFNINPTTQFESRVGGPSGTAKFVSYQDQYQSKYQKTITDTSQPLLIMRTVRGQTVVLVPELCSLTGLTDKMKSNFNLMKAMTEKTQLQPSQRMNKCQKLLENIRNNKKCQEECKQWGIGIDPNPPKFTGHTLDAGNILLGQGKTINLKTRPNFDRDIQGPMYAQPGLRKWALFVGSKDKNLADQFLKELQTACARCQQNANPPNIVEIQNDRRADEWIQKIGQIAAPDVDFLFFILPGSRGKDDFNLQTATKRFLMESAPIPSQMILSGTLRRGKNLTSIVSKILVQVCAKSAGGEPWVLENPPTCDEPTMICGIDVQHGPGTSKSVLALVASVNRNLSRQYSGTAVHVSKEELSSQLQALTKEAVDKFKSANHGVSPKKVIVQRDGVSEGQKQAVIKSEVEQVNRALFESTGEDTRLIQIIVNKLVSARFFEDVGGNLTNPSAGTCIDNTVTRKNQYEYYLMPLKPRVGTASPTQFHCIQDSSSQGGSNRVGIKDIASLTYRLSFCQYNWAAAIRIPSPVMFAHKLAALVGERGDRQRDPPTVHKAFSNYLSHQYL